MSAFFREMKAQHLDRLAQTVGAASARILIALAVLPGLAACRISPGAAQQTVAKAVTRVKPMNDTPTVAPTATPIPINTPAPTSTPASTAQPVAIGTNGGDWQFDAATLEIAAGKEIALTFHNGAKTTVHNWLLIKGGDDVATAINAAGEQAGEQAAYIPNDARIIARTNGLVKGGQSETVTFTVPAAGSYIYLCTFPGHFEEGMRGVLTVK